MTHNVTLKLALYSQATRYNICPEGERPLNAGLPWEWGEGVTEWRRCAFLESVFKWNLWINQSSSFGICNEAILAISLCRCTVFFKNGKAFNIVYKITGQPLFRPPHTSLHLPGQSINNTSSLQELEVKRWWDRQKTEKEQRQEMTGFIWYISKRQWEKGMIFRETVHLLL